MIRLIASRPWSLRLAAALSLALALYPAPAHSQDSPPARVPSLDDSPVLIPYSELRRLLAAAVPSTTTPAQPPPAPVPACLTQAAYRLSFVQKQPQLLATFTVENLTDHWASVSLGHCHATHSEPLPPDTRLTRIKGDLHLLLEKSQRVELTLQLVPSADGAFLFAPPLEAALTTLAVAEPPPDQVIQILHTDGRNIRHANATTIGLEATDGPLRLSLVDHQNTEPAAATMNSLIITDAAFQTQVAQDGAQLTSVRLLVEHSSPERLTLQLPTGAELLRCTVGGKPILLEPTGPEALSLPLAAPIQATPPATTGQTEIVLSYFLQGEKLHEAEGELTLSLPRTPQLIRQLEWTVELPEDLELTAHGTIAIQPAAAPQRHVLQLSRRLCRDSATEARITYRKPNTVR